MKNNTRSNSKISWFVPVAVLALVLNPVISQAALAPSLSGSNSPTQPLLSASSAPAVVAPSVSSEVGGLVASFVAKSLVSAADVPVAHISSAILQGVLDVNAGFSSLVSQATNVNVLPNGDVNLEGFGNVNRPAPKFGIAPVEWFELDPVERFELDPVERFELVDPVERFELDPVERFELDPVERFELDPVERFELDPVAPPDPVISAAPINLPGDPPAAPGGADNPSFSLQQSPLQAPWSERKRPNFVL